MTYGHPFMQACTFFYPDVYPKSEFVSKVLTCIVGVFVVVVSNFGSMVEQSWSYKDRES